MKPIWLMLPLLLLTNEPVSSSEKPNIILVFIDDMGWGDFSCFGNVHAKTPNIDRMAEQGIRFEQFYVNSPICSPSRTAISTGQYPQRWRITSYLAHRKMNEDRGMAQWLSPEAPMLARSLQKAGYTTGHFGKWHMGGQRDVADAPAITEYGFDTSLTNFEGMGPKLLPLTLKPGQDEPKKIWGDAERLGEGARWMLRSELTTGFVDAAIPFIDQAVAAGQPFYINLWPDDVHSPFWPPVAKWGDGSKRRLYLSVLESMDQQLGRLFDRVQNDERLSNNTLILICSDNGPELGAGEAGPFRGYKTHLYEGGIRSPLIAWGPGIVAKRGFVDKDSVFSAIDLAPTLLSLSGIELGESTQFDGESLVETLKGQGGSRTEPIYFRRPPDRDSFYGVTDLPDLAMRQGPYKLLCEYDGSGAELYDLNQDRSETNNLAAQLPSVVNQMVAKLLNWHQSMPADKGETYASRRKRKPPNPKKESPQASIIANPNSTKTKQSRPNIVILLADDLGWNTVGFHNASYSTPNIDSIAANGIELNQFHVAPMCSPTRAGMLTGRYPIRFGLARAVIPPQRDFGIPESESKLGEMLRSLGYSHRGIFGKWHLGHRRSKWHPLANGFTYFHGHYNGAIDYFDLTREQTRDWHTNYSTSDETGYATDLIAKSAAQWITKHSADADPYFCYVPFNAPHSPFQAPQDAIAKYAPLSGTEKRRDANGKTYQAMVGRMDEGIGQILTAIKNSGEADNTLVWFFSDNGGVSGLSNLNRPLRGAKLSVYEGGTRIPASVSWPKRIKPGLKSESICGYIDILPTIVSIAGGNADTLTKNLLDGVDLSKILTGETADVSPRPWFSYHGQGGEKTEHLAVIKEGWKLKVNGPVLKSLEQLEDGRNEVELFQLSVDPYEQRNVRGEQRNRVNMLGKLLIEHRALQPADSVPPYNLGKDGFVPPENWRLDPSNPNQLVGSTNQK